MFPPLAPAGSLYGHVDRGYWRDIGTPDSYLQAHFDILERQRRDGAWPTCSATQYLYVAPAARSSTRARASCRRATSPTACASRPAPGSARWPCWAPAARVGEGATVIEAVVQADVVIGAHAQVEGSILVRGSSVGAGTQLDGAVARRGLRGRRRQPARRRHLPVPGDRAAGQLHPVPRTAPRQGGRDDHPRRHLQGVRHPRPVPAGARRGGRRAHRLRPGAAAGRVPARRGHGPAALVGRAGRGVRRRRGRGRRGDRRLRPRAHGDAVLRRRLAGAGRRRHGDRVAQPAAVQRHEARAATAPCRSAATPASPSSRSGRRR